MGSIDARRRRLGHCLYRTVVMNGSTSAPACNSKADGPKPWNRHLVQAPYRTLILLSIICSDRTIFSSATITKRFARHCARRRPNKMSSLTRRNIIICNGNGSFNLMLRGGGNDVDGAGCCYSTHSMSGNGEVASVAPKQPQPSASTSQQSPFEYIPITALDDYGQSTQLRHVMESATKFGTPVLACICCEQDDERTTENAIVVCSLQRPRPGVISPSLARISRASFASRSKSSLKSIHPSIQGMVRIVATRDDMHHSAISQDDVPQLVLHTAIITTGIQSDAHFLLSQLQSHFSKYWFRYDNLPSISSSASMMVVKMVRDVLLDCLGYDWGNEVNSGKITGGLGSAAPSYNEGEDEDGDNGSASRAGRPLGICTFLLGLDYKTHPFITVIKANGASQQYVAHAMGMCSQLANKKLLGQWRRCMSQEEAKDMMKDILKDVAKERGWLLDGDASNTGDDARLTMTCETVTQKGIDVDFLPLV
ncbi:hypothetical protein ACHAWF_013857 [Thalassiosira exigua]